MKRKGLLLAVLLILILTLSSAVFADAKKVEPNKPIIWTGSLTYCMGHSVTINGKIKLFSEEDPENENINPYDNFKQTYSRYEKADRVIDFSNADCENIDHNNNNCVKWKGGKILYFTIANDRGNNHPTVYVDMLHSKEEEGFHTFQLNYQGTTKTPDGSCQMYKW